MPQINIPQSAILWLAGGERGISSETIVSVLYDLPISGRWGLSHPHDPDDLKRCIKLLQGSPETAARFAEMREVSPEWRTLVDHWKELEGLFWSEVDLQTRWSAPKTFARMRDLVDECRANTSNSSETQDHNA